ncbi:MAG TPA: S8 family serine peptidase [Rudaea sp.]
MYAIRVFGCGGGTSVLSQAIEWSMDPNGDGDLSDHLDVINMSLGSPLGFPSDVDAIASDNAAAAGVIVVAAAGNDGDAFFTNGSPASSLHAISVAAIVDGGRPGVILSETAPQNSAFPALDSLFTNPDGSAPVQVAGQSGQLVAVDDGTPPVHDGCDARFVNSVAGNIALIARGACSFADKVVNAQNNGAIGVVVVDNLDGAVPVAIGGNPSIALTIPAISVSKATGEALNAQLAAGPVNVALQTASAGDTFAAFSSRGPVGDFDGKITLKPDLAAPGFDIPSAQSGVTCPTADIGCLTPATGGYIPGGQILVLSGTSMATPHVAGMMALLRQLNPAAPPDEIKALAMNSAVHDVHVGADGLGPRYGARSIGAGRVDVAAAAQASIELANGEVPGATALAFDIEPVGITAIAHTVRITNRSNDAQTVDLSIDDIDDAPGVRFDIAGATTLTLPAGASQQIIVSTSADTTQMKRALDPTLSSTVSLPTGETIPRTFFTEKSSLLKVSRSGAEVARLALYAALRPHSSMGGILRQPLSAQSTRADIDLSGIDVCTGTRSGGAQNPACASQPNGEVSLVSPFELQLVADRNDALPGFASLHHVGVNYIRNPDQGDILTFGISTWGKWTSPSAVSYDICLDTDGDGSFDKILYNTDFGGLNPLLTGGPPTTSDGYLSVSSDGIFAFLEFPLNLVDAQTADTGQLSNNTMILAAAAADLGISATSKIRYGVAVCPGGDPQCARSALLAQPATQCAAPDALASFNGPYVYDIAHPGIDGHGNLLAQDLDGATLSVPYDEASLGRNGSLGLLLLHHHNTSDKSADVVILDRLFGSGFDVQN